MCTLYILVVCTLVWDLLSPSSVGDGWSWWSASDCAFISFQSHTMVPTWSTSWICNKILRSFCFTHYSSHSPVHQKGSPVITESTQYPHSQTYKTNTARQGLWIFSWRDWKVQSCAFWCTRKSKPIDGSDPPLGIMLVASAEDLRLSGLWSFCLRYIPWYVVSYSDYFHPHWAFTLSSGVSCFWKGSRTPLNLMPEILPRSLSTIL
jgi:hypothetical protein